jgi:hypothetical protein
MPHAFLSQAWFDHAVALTGDLPVRPGLSYRVQLEAGGTTWHQVVEDGRVTSWEEGPLPDAALVLRWAPADALAIHRGELAGTEALAATTVVGRGAGGERVEGRPSPLDIDETGALAELPTIPGATLVIQYRFAHGPFGPVDYWWSFDEGRSVGMGLGVVDEPDVGVGITYARMVGVRQGRITILEALEHGGTVTGELGPLMLLGGLEESPELHAAELACGPSGPVLAAMGELAATPAYAEAWSALTETTS